MLRYWRSLTPLLLAALLVTACTKLPLHEHGDTPTDGQLKIQALTELAQAVAELEAMRPGLVSGIENLGDKDEKTLLHVRFEEALLTELTRRGLFAGSDAGERNGTPPKSDDPVDDVTGGATGGNVGADEAQGRYDNLPPGEREERERQDRERQDREGGTRPPAGGGTTDQVVQSGSLSYRLIECRVLYYKSGNSVRRQAVARVHLRLPSATGDGYAWVGELEASSEDYVRVAVAESLLDTRYPEIGPTPPEADKAPILEPIIVTVVTVGLILLFSFTSQ